MSTKLLEIRSYADAARFWSESIRPPRRYVPLRKNTWLHYSPDDGTFRVRYFTTDVVVYARIRDKDWVWVRSGGYMTESVRQRINQYTPNSVIVFPDWLVLTPLRDGAVVRFHDGLRVA